MMAEPDVRDGRHPTAVGRVLTRTGVAGALIGFGSTLLATLLSPTFTWSTSALSDLGAPGATTPWLFNGGLVIAGVVALPFGWVLVSTARHSLERLGAALFAASVVALALVGAFPSGSALHVPAAVAYFTLLTFALWIHGSGTVLAGDVRRGLTALWLGIVHVLQWLLWAAGIRVGDGLAIPELVGSVVLLAWLAQTTRWIHRRQGT